MHCVYSTLCLLVLLSACQRPTAPDGLPTTDDWIVENVSVLRLVDSTVLDAQDVWISGGSIVGMAPTGCLQWPKGTQRLDGTGQYLMPGLADMHVHLPEDDAELQAFLLLHLMAGVTQLRSMRGRAQHVELREAIQRGTRIGPRLYLASQPIRKNLEMTPDDVDALLQRYRDTGYDAVKILSVSDSTTFQALVAASAKYDLPLCGHVSSNIGLEATVQSGVYTSIEHLGGYFEAYRAGPEVFRSGLMQTVARNVYNCATLDYYDTHSSGPAALRQRDGLQYVPDRLAEWETAYAEYTAEKDSAQLRAQTQQYTQARLGLLRILHQSGARLLISPDATGLFAVPGFSMLREMQLHERAGISRIEVLQMATANAAEFIGATNRGTVGVGQAADLVLLGANPLEQLEHLKQVKGVFVGGRWHSRTELEKRLKQAQAGE